MKIQKISSVAENPPLDFEKLFDTAQVEIENLEVELSTLHILIERIDKCFMQAVEGQFSKNLWTACTILHRHPVIAGNRENEVKHRKRQRRRSGKRDPKKMNGKHRPLGFKHGDQSCPDQSVKVEKAQETLSLSVQDGPTLT